ncbi:MAG: hypothetical protein WCO63_13540 [Bacteroidota bacterium]
MKLIIFAGPPTCGKTTVIKQVIRRILKKGLKPAYLKIDVLYADEDVQFNRELVFPLKKYTQGSSVLTTAT